MEDNETKALIITTVIIGFLYLLIDVIIWYYKKRTNTLRKRKYSFYFKYVWDDSLFPGLIWFIFIILSGIQIIHIIYSQVLKHIS